MVLKSEDAIARVREILGRTDSSKAVPESLRWHYYQKYQPENGYDNFAHASGSHLDFGREMVLLLSDARTAHHWKLPR
jgi:nucleoside diphosphate kinase